MNPIRPKTIDKIQHQVDAVKGEVNMVRESLEEIKKEAVALTRTLDGINLSVAGGNVPNDEELAADNILLHAKSVVERLGMLKTKIQEYGEM